MAETRIRPQNLELNVLSTQLVPSVSGMLWVDSNNILRVDSVGSGVETDFVTVIPEHTITGEHGPKVTINQTTTDSALDITKGGLNPAVSISCGTTNAGRAIDVVSVSNTASAVYVTQNGNGPGMTILRSGTGVEQALTVRQSGPGIAIQIYQSTAYNAVKIEKSNTSTGAVLQVLNSGTGAGIDLGSTAAGIGLQVSQSGNAHAARISKSNTGNEPALAVYGSASSGAAYIRQSGTNAGYGLYVNQIATGNADAIVIDVGANARHGIRINNSSTGNGINIANTGNGYGINIDQTGSSPGLVVSKYNALDAEGAILVTNHSGFGCGIEVAIPNDGQDGIIINKTDTTAAGLASGNCLQINNTSGAVPVSINHENTGSANVINITNSGSGYDIRGNAGNWSVDSAGNAIFASIVETSTQQTIFTFDWTASSAAQSTGALGFTPRVAFALMKASGATSVGFATGTGTNAKLVSWRETYDADTTDYGNAYGDSAIAGASTTGTGQTNTLANEIDVTVWSASGITLKPSASVTARVYLLVMG